ncbi:hypothetical protein AVEN_161960-1 [Araneus ventricosus]|uniref:Uncharacterized protein n=1 Tax=Araneus ventricosus TaxID=182803 RepID=A0A4Y2LPX5_ARAVE|nr:hypothetical protein AVEN_161960-1 [Araneus ventricosus]
MEESGFFVRQARGQTKLGDFKQDFFSSYSSRFRRCEIVQEIRPGLRRIKMAECKELETLVYCLGPVGGQENPVFTKESAYTSKYDYTTKGYARYIQEANNVIRFQYLVIDYFLETVKSEFEEDPLAFIDAENEEDMLASIQKMKKQWREMFKEHQKKLRESLRNQKQAIEQSLDESSSSSSSAKIPRLDPEVTSEAGSKLPERDAEGTLEAASVGIPVEKIEFPESIFLRKARDFARVLKTEYQELRARMGKALDRISSDDTVHDLKGFTFQNMEKFAKWKYVLKTLGHLVPQLESKLGELDLDMDKIKENENRLTDWMYFDDGKKDRKYHHRILIPMELTVSVEEISAIIWRQMRRYRQIKKSLEKQLPQECAAFNVRVAHWKYEVLYNRPVKKPARFPTSAQSDDTYCSVEEMPVDI